MRVVCVAVYEGEMSKARERCEGRRKKGEKGAREGARKAREVREGARRRKKAYGGERRKRKKTVRNGSAVVEFRSSLLAILCC